MRQRKEALGRVYREAEIREQQLAAKAWSGVGAGRSAGGVIAMVVVMTIVGAMLVSRSTQFNAPAPRNTPPKVAQREVQVLRIALERFRRDIGHYPTQEEAGLMALIHDTGHWEWRRPYVTMLRPDPWGTPYYYDVNTNGLTLFSCGPDKRPHTEDDILSSVPSEEDLQLNADALLPDSP